MQNKTTKLENQVITYTGLIILHCSVASTSFLSIFIWLSAFLSRQLILDYIFLFAWFLFHADVDIKGRV